MDRSVGAECWRRELQRSVVEKRWTEVLVKSVGEE